MDKKFVHCKRIHLEKATPGMVLAEDVRGAGGGILLPAEYTLSREAIDRLLQFGIDAVYIEKAAEHKERDALHGKKAIVVSDSLFFRHMFAKLLYRMGMFVCDETENAEDGIRRAAEYKPDVMIVDIDLADSAGYDLIKRIRQKYPAIRIFAISTFHDKVHILEALKAGACDYLAKPVRWEALKPRLLKMLSPDAAADAKPGEGACAGPGAGQGSQ